MNPLDQLGTFWAEHQLLITVIGVVLAGIAATSFIAWVLRKIVRPIIAVVSGTIATGIGATATGFLTHASSAAGSWVTGG